MCPAKPSRLVPVQMASGQSRVTEVTSESGPTDARQLGSFPQRQKTLPPVAWLGLVLGARCGSWAKIEFSRNNLFDKDAQEEMPLAAGDEQEWDGTGKQAQVIWCPALHRRKQPHFASIRLGI